MRDQISKERVAALHPKAIPVFTEFIENAEEMLMTTFRVTEAFRTFEDQARIYSLGRTAPGRIVSYAIPGKSWHNYGLAIDLAELKDGKLNWFFNYTLLEPLSKVYGLTWGGRFVVKGKPFPDRPHFQLSLGYTVSQLYDKYKAGEFIEGTHFINI